MWDYLIVTAANERQAEAYRFLIRQREKAGQIPQVRTCLAIPDIEGKRIGSGGSTLHCLDQVLQRERTGGPGTFEEAGEILSGLRILIVHAGGDSRRLPAYSPCGKMFVPVPAEGDSPVAGSLFDRLTPVLLKLPEARPGQVVVASGDALILFDPSSVEFRNSGITALGITALASEAVHHGVFCAGEDGSVRRFLQKPTVETQIAAAAVNPGGESVLDLGIMSFEAGSAVQLMRMFFEIRSRQDGNGALVWRREAKAAMLASGIDLYREVCCSLGTSTTLDQYVENVRTAGSTVDEGLLTEWFEGLRKIPFHLETLEECRFFHFGTTRQLITSGIALIEEDAGGPATSTVVLGSEVHGVIAGNHAWIEGCTVRGELTLEGWNAVAGTEVVESLDLPRGACLDMSSGVGREGKRVWFFRYHGIDDTFKRSPGGDTFCGGLLTSWLAAMGAGEEDIWPRELPQLERNLWNARLFPAFEDHQEYRGWMWLFAPETGTEDQRIRFLEADRYSSSEIALRVNQQEFHERRSRLRAAAMLSKERTGVQTLHGP